MALDFANLRVEVFARGFDYLNDAGAGLTRVKRWINEASHEINAEERWDYLLTTLVSTLPLTIADLDRVESIVDAAGFAPLIGVDRASLVHDVVDLTTTGYPVYWYKTAPTTIHAYPVSTTSLTIRYFKFGAEMTADGDQPLVPDRWRQAIVERVCAKAFRDSNDYDAATDCLNEYGRLVQQMRESLLVPPSFVARRYSALDD